MRTFADWLDPLPGFFEIDMVEHCGGPKTDGDYVHTLTLTDIATGWTECVASRLRTSRAFDDRVGYEAFVDLIAQRFNARTTTRLAVERRCSGLCQVAAPPSTKSCLRG